jgi:hypothetical protein
MATLTIGVLHHPEKGRRYAFALFQGEVPALPNDLRASLEEDFGVFTGDAVIEPDAAGP